MDPKSAERQELLRKMQEQMGPLNVYALSCYARLLQRCGVRQMNVKMLVL